LEVDVSRLSYETIHWGTQPRFVEELLVPKGRGEAVGELEAISYVTVKKGDPTVYRHEFERFDGRLPYLLEGRTDGKGSFAFPRPSSDLIAMGRVVDMELIDPETGEKRRIYTPFLWVVTTKADPKVGGPVLLASRFAPIHAIEHRNGNPHIKEHGIIN